MTGTHRILIGDNRDTLITVPTSSIQCIVTSPPYWGLRSYHGNSGMIGMEATFAEHLANLMQVFKECWRVLRDDGTLWLNYGDAYSRAAAPGACIESASAISKLGSSDGAVGRGDRPGTRAAELPEKNILGMPWRIAFALQDEGWTLRQDIIWHKPNPMPESVTDRCTKAHEYLFLLTKRPRYFYDAEAIKEVSAYPDDKRRPLGSAGAWEMDGREQRENGGGEPYEHNTATRNRRSVWTIPTAPFADAHFATFPPALVEPCIKAGTSERGCCPACGAPWARALAMGHTAKGPTAAGSITPDRVRTTGWTPTCACDGVDRRIVGSPTGERGGDDPTLETGRKGMNRPRGDNEGTRPITRYEQAQYADQLKASPHRTEMESEAGNAFAHYLRTDDSGARPVPGPLLEAWIGRGWLRPVVVPGIVPGFEPVPCVCLDPFGGSGTVAAVACPIGRNAIICEISPDYAAMAEDRIGRACRPNTHASKRTTEDAPLFDPPAKEVQGTLL